MRTRGVSNPFFRPTLAAPLLLLLLCVLWFAGGASRGDVLGQTVVRATTWALLVLGLFFGTRPSFSDVRPVMLLLIATIVLPLLQLIPLPPQIWQALPNRDFFAEAAAASGQDQPWRPLSIVPGATLNALSAMIVPVVVLILVVGLTDSERTWLPSVMLGVVSGSMLIGLLQFSGAGFSSPMVNDQVGGVSGTFANRNHFAVFLAFGCVLAPVWARINGRISIWRGGIAIGLIILFFLAILASGSRMGIVVGILGIVLGSVSIHGELRQSPRRATNWVSPTLVAAIIGMFAILIIVSIASDRAESINRAMAVNFDDDLRSRSFTTVLAMIGTYLPFGTGFGTFDPLFRMVEPSEFLQVSYFNNAHNDFLEVALNGGIPGIVLVVVALCWWAFASRRVWRAATSDAVTLGKIGSAMLLLVFVASVSDYPARTPLIMAWITIAAIWLSWGARASRSRLALPA